jgi:hypothetical protein
MPLLRARPVPGLAVADRVQGSSRKILKKNNNKNKNKKKSIKK